ncbi:hypothetical protein S40293_09831 [Stachybotrys chartarum IBT 40293]|nr:hypothetical protein S40293_09831 [Stachybotrys chartarum IBT 40293]
MNRGAPRRRNGRLQACDPCRSRKVACDHTQPACLRCRRRKQDQECIYTISDNVHPASVTSNCNARDSYTIRSLLASARPSTSFEAHSSASTPHSSRARCNTASNLTTPALSNHASDSPKLPPRVVGYLGFTSHSPLYQETSHRLSRLQGTTSAVPTSTSTTDQEPSNRNDFKPLSPETLDMCQAVLGSLPLLDSLRVTNPPRTPINIRDGWAMIIAKRVMESLQSHIGSEEEGRHSRLEELGRLLCQNTARPVFEEAVNVEEWMTSYTGDNLRWESIGVIFTYYDEPKNSSKLTTEGNRREGRGSPSRRFFLQNLNLCIKLSRTFSDGNLLLLHLYGRRAILVSVSEGDAVLSCWEAHSKTVALLTFMGLHTEQETSSYVPTFTSELRRRLFANIFNVDKDFSSTGGRPPLLSARYVSTSPPLDLRDEAFLGNTEAFKEAVSEVDELGWNTNGVMSPATLSRSRTILAYIHDELLGLALANKKSVRMEDIMAVKKKAQEVINELPQCIIYREEDIHDYSIRYELVLGCMFIREEYLVNLFLVERLLQRQGVNVDAELLLISFEMVTLTLKFWIHQDRFCGAINDFEGLVLGFGAPGGGVLSMELLRPTFSGPHHPRNRNITRSSIIQQLSLLVGFLGWVGPDAPNADLCAGCRTVIQHVLDHTFNHGVTLSTDQEQPNMFHQRKDGMDCVLGEPEYGGDADFGFDLLDTFSWLRNDDLGIWGTQDSVMM